MCLTRIGFLAGIKTADCHEQARYLHVACVESQSQQGNSMLHAWKDNHNTEVGSSWTLPKASHKINK